MHVVDAKPRPTHSRLPLIATTLRVQGHTQTHHLGGPQTKAIKLPTQSLRAGLHHAPSPPKGSSF